MTLINGLSQITVSHPVLGDFKFHAKLNSPGPIISPGIPIEPERWNASGSFKISRKDYDMVKRLAQSKKARLPRKYKKRLKVFYKTNKRLPYSVYLTKCFLRVIAFNKLRRVDKVRFPARTSTH